MRDEIIANSTRFFNCKNRKRELLLFLSWFVCWKEYNIFFKLKYKKKKTETYVYNHKSQSNGEKRKIFVCCSWSILIWLLYIHSFSQFSVFFSVFLYIFRMCETLSFFLILMNVREGSSLSYHFICLLLYHEYIQFWVLFFVSSFVNISTLLYTRPLPLWSLF